MKDTFDWKHTTHSRGPLQISILAQKQIYRNLQLVFFSPETKECNNTLN